MHNKLPDGQYRFGYGTYGMPDLAPAEALPRLKEMGYEGIELNVGANYPTAPEKLSGRNRKELRSLFADLDLHLTGLMLMSQPLVEDPGEYERQLENLRACAQLAAELAAGETAPTLVTTVGGNPDQWDDGREFLVQRMKEYGQVAAEFGTQIAVEPHWGSILNSPDQTVWLMERIDSPAVGVNFDISHFEVAGFPLVESTASQAPYTIHTHVKDGRLEDGKCRYLLAGEGDTDYVTYFETLAATGWFGYITVEITAMIFRQKDYDPWSAAEFSLKTLQKALSEARL
jgi:sugar phosphate isomerase/epimerase